MAASLLGRAGRLHYQPARLDRPGGRAGPAAGHDRRGGLGPSGAGAGPLVVTEPELPAVTDALQAHGIVQTALHKHLPEQSPPVW